MTGLERALIVSSVFDLQDYPLDLALANSLEGFEYIFVKLHGSFYFLELYFYN